MGASLGSPFEPRFSPEVEALLDRFQAAEERACFCGPDRLYRFVRFMSAFYAPDEFRAQAQRRRSGRRAVAFRLAQLLEEIADEKGAVGQR